MAVDDSPAALAAVRVAVDLAVRGGGVLRFVHVLGDGEVARSLASMGHDGALGARRSRDAAALLRRVAAEAHRAGVEAETSNLEGEPAASLLLEEAKAWSADLIVLGRSDARGAGRPYVGALTQQVLEFSEQPVLVVPRPV